MNTTKRVCMSIAALLIAFSMIEPAQAGILDTILNRVNAIRSSVNEMVTSLREGRQQVTSDLKNSINEALETARTTIDEERQGRDDFIERGETVANADLDGAKAGVWSNIPPHFPDRFDRFGIDQRNHETLKFCPIEQSIGQPRRGQTFKDLYAARGQPRIGAVEEW